MTDLYERVALDGVVAACGALVGWVLCVVIGTLLDEPWTQIEGGGIWGIIVGCALLTALAFEVGRHEERGRQQRNPEG